MDGVLYDQDQAPDDLPLDPQANPVPAPHPSMWGNIGNQVSNQVSNGVDALGRGISNVRDFATQNPDMLMAAAAGIGKGTPMGEMAASLNDHFKLQAEMKQKKDANAALMSLNRDKLSEAQRLNSSKIDANTAKALKDGTAKVTNLGNGFISVVKPGDTTPTEIAYGDYQNFLREQTQTKGEYGMLAAGAKIDAQPLSAAQEKLIGDATEKANSANITLDRWQRAKSLLEAQGAPELAGLPFVSRIAQILGSDSTAAYQVLSQLKVDEGFTNIPHGQGSMSNIEREMLMAPIPSMDASTDVWLNYINRRLPLIEQAATKHQAYAEQLANRPKTGVATMQGVIQGMHPQQAPQAPVAPANPPAQPVQAAAPVQPQQKYPAGFNPPNNGRSPPEDQLAILKQEYADESAKPDTPAKAQNLIALRNELSRLGFKPQGSAPAAAPAAGPMTFSTAAEVQAAIKAGKLKSGDTFKTPDGKVRKVH